MVSSVPHFPAPVSNKYQYKVNGTKYGQTVMCVTIDRSIKTTIRTFVTVESFEFVVVHFLCYIN